MAGNEASNPSRDASPPRRVAVIGAGIIGLSAAIWLQRAGHEVTIFDRNDPEDRSTWRQASSFGNACTFATGACLPVAMPGIAAAVPRMLLDPDGPLALRMQDLPGLTPWLIAFLRASTVRQVDRIVRELGKLIRAAGEAQDRLLEWVGAAHLVKRHGCLYLYKDEAGFSAARRDIELREREGVAMTILSRDEVHDRAPNLAPLYHKGLQFDDAWQFDTPYDYILSLARHFGELGGSFRRAEIRAIRPATEAIGLEGDPDAQAFERVVLAAGAWSRKLARRLGEPVLLDTERGYHVVFPEAGNLLDMPVCYPDHGFYMTPTREGLRCAGTVELGGLDKPPRRNRIDVIERVTRRLLPAVGPRGDDWMGFRPSMPDSLPVISHGSRDRRVIHAYGHGHIGITLAAITGQLVAELVSDQPPSLDLSALRIDRFA